MARGNFARITYRTGAGVAVEEIEAKTAGGDVEITMPGKNDLFIEVQEINKAEKPVRTARFLASEVLSIVEGQKPAQKMGRIVDPVRKKV